MSLDAGTRETAPIRVAIIGCGAIAGAHAEAVLMSGSSELVGAVDTSDVARGRAETEWSCAAYSSIRELLTEHEVDVACVCTPPASHRVLTEELLIAGVHVLCEKPLAVSSADARSMMRTAEDRVRMLAVSAKFLYVSDLAEAGRLIRDGRIGRPLSFEVTFCSPVDVDGRWNTRPQESGGGVVIDNAPHALDVLSHVLESPIRRVAAELTRSGPETVEDSAEILFATENGEMGRIGLSWTYFTKDLDYLVVQGSKGTLRVGWTGGNVRTHGSRDWTPFGEGYDKRAAFGHQLAAVRAALVGTPAGEASRMSGDGIRALELVEAVYRSSATGTSETVSASPSGQRTAAASATP